MPDTGDLRKWARNLRVAADHLGAVDVVGIGPRGTLYEGAKRIVNEVADEMYAANDEAAREAWVKVLAKGAERVG